MRLIALSIIVTMIVSLIKAEVPYERYGGIYFAYPEKEHIYTPAPDGFHPFYISHFARHGSRWLPDDYRYENVNKLFEDTTNLTNLGKDVRLRLLKIYEDARGRGGDLTSRGERQHMQMAERMFSNYKEVFADNAEVSARSSVVGRCIMSMNAFLIRLSQLNPDLNIKAEANRRYMDYIAYTSPEIKMLEDSVQGKWQMDTRRLMNSLFINPYIIEADRNLVSELHTIASDMQNVEIGISLYDIFTESEMSSIYKMHNERMQFCNGINSGNRNIPERCAASLWQNIVISADEAIRENRPAATLRFGHDTSLYRLLSLLGLYADENRMDVIIPMGANLQIIFYKKDANEVIVKFLHNEEEMLLPDIDNRINKKINPPYYYWESVKECISSKHSFLSMADKKITKSIAFISDAHVQDVMGRPDLVRSMDSQVRSTRLFNENQFALIAALDDLVRRNISLVVFPGDLTDDGQKVNQLAVKKILQKYTNQYGMNFFVTTGNHDPVRPYGSEYTGRNFLTETGENASISSNYIQTDNNCIKKDSLLACMGYKDMMTDYDEFGYFPQEKYIYWECPFSSYNYDNYTYTQAINESNIENRNYILNDSIKSIDASYLVEPIEDIWLLAIDGNVYLPDNDINGAQTYHGSTGGYNYTLQYKKFLIPWITKIADEAKKRNKFLITFCHYPLLDFNHGASKFIASRWKNTGFDLSRLPSDYVSKTLLEAGIKIHVAGHMHINSSALMKDADNKCLYGIQVPSIATCIPAYKVLTPETQQRVRVETIVLDSVPSFNSLFPLYEKEFMYLMSKGIEPEWNKEILNTSNYMEFCNMHFRDLVKLRLIPRDMPEILRDNFLEMNGTEIMQKVKHRKYSKSSDSYIKWTGFDLILDLYRLRYAGKMALVYIPEERLAQYQTLFDELTTAKNYDDEFIIRLKDLATLFTQFITSHSCSDLIIDFETS